MFIDNDWWGHKYVLAKYCGIRPKPIFGSMQHGVYTLDEEINWNLNKKRSFDLIPYFCNSDFFFQKCKKKKINNIVAIGAPFLYLDKISPLIKREKGTIVFPAHSGLKRKVKGFTLTFEKKKRVFDHEGFIKNVEKHNNPPYTVSIIKDDYWYMSQFYKRKNWKIFSAGDRYDKFFLINIHKLISQNTHAVFTEFTSAMWYSMYLGLNVRLAVKSHTSKLIVPYAGKINSKDQRSFITFKKRYPLIFSGKFSTHLAKNLAKERMGYDCLKNKKELKKILGWDSNLRFFAAYILKKLYNLKYKYKKSF